MVVAIGNEAEVIAPLSADRASQARAIAALDAWSTTALHDAHHRDARSPRARARSPGHRRLLGRDGSLQRAQSRGGAWSAHGAATRSSIRLRFGGTRPPLLSELAVLTGGRSFLLRDARELEKTLATIARELRYQYLLGYTPAKPIEKGDREMAINRASR